MELHPRAAGLSCHFAPGQRVVCLSGGPWFDISTPSEQDFAGPEKGAVCLVTDVLKSPALVRGHYVDEIYLRLEGWASVFHHLNFRPLRETSIEVFEKLLCGTPTSEPITRREREEVR